MIAPTITIPWMKFVPDISGVCSIVGTFEITSKPRKIASTRIVSSTTRPRSVTPPPRPFARHAGAGGDLVVEVERELAAPREVLEQRGDVARVEPARVGGHQRRHVGSPTIVTPSCSISWPGCVSSQLPPVSAARSTITEPARMRSTAAAGMSSGAGRPGIERRRDHDVEVGDPLLEGVLLRLLLPA